MLFCVSKKGWGWERFLAEANQGRGLKFPGIVRFYVTYILPVIVLLVFVLGYWDKFGGEEIRLQKINILGQNSQKFHNTIRSSCVTPTLMV